MDALSMSPPKNTKLHRKFRPALQITVFGCSQEQKVCLIYFPRMSQSTPDGDWQQYKKFRSRAQQYLVVLGSYDRVS
jgi:hypothetical protein